MANIIDAFPKGASGDTVQYATLPTASADNVGQIVQYIGVDTSTLTNGFFYICANDSGTYKWKEKLVSENTEGHTIVDTDGNDMTQEEKLKFTGFDVTDDSTNGVTEVGAVGLNADSLADITSGNISNGFVTNGMVFSTSEQVVGKWIDGKPLYQKTILSNTGSGNVSVSISDLDLETLVSMSGAVHQTANGKLYWSPLFYNGANSSDYMNSAFIAVDDNNLNIVTTTGYHNFPVHITIQYTKTTD